MGRAQQVWLFCSSTSVTAAAQAVLSTPAGNGTCGMALLVVRGCTMLVGSSRATYRFGATSETAGSR